MDNDYNRSIIKKQKKLLGMFETTPEHIQRTIFGPNQVPEKTSLTKKGLVSILSTLALGIGTYYYNFSDNNTYIPNSSVSKGYTIVTPKVVKSNEINQSTINNAIKHAKAMPVSNTSKVTPKKQNYTQNYHKKITNKPLPEEKYVDKNILKFNNGKNTCDFNTAEFVLNKDENIVDRFNYGFNASDSCDTYLDKSKKYDVKSSGKNLGNLIYNSNKGWQFSNQIKNIINRKADTNLINIIEKEDINQRVPKSKFVQNNSNSSCKTNYTYEVSKADCKLTPTGKTRYPKYIVQCDYKSSKFGNGTYAFTIPERRHNKCYGFDLNNGSILTDKTVSQKITNQELPNAVSKYIFNAYSGCK